MATNTETGPTGANTPEQQPKEAPKVKLPLAEMQGKSKEEVQELVFERSGLRNLPEDVRRWVLSDPKAYRQAVGLASDNFGAFVAEWPEEEARLVNSFVIASVNSREAASQLPPERIGLPTGLKTVDEVQAEIDAEKSKEASERIAGLQEKLDGLRDELAAVSAKRGTRMFTRKSGELAGTFEMLNGQYNKILQELTVAKLDNDPEFAAKDSKERLQKGMMFMIEQQRLLRQDTTANMEGTKLGKVVKWMNEGGRLKKFMKYAGVGLIAGAAGFATGGVAGAGAAAAIGAGFRAFRGYSRSQDNNNARQLEDVDDTILNEIIARGGKITDLVGAGAAALAASFEGSLRDVQKKARKGVYAAGGYALAGFGIGFAVDRISDFVQGASSASAVQLVNNEGPTPGSAAHARMAEVASMDSYNKWVGDFGYNPQENPFFQPGKTGIHDMGPALRPDAPGYTGPAGLQDLTENRWVNSPEQFASIVQAMGLNNLPDSLQNADALAEHFKLAPHDHMQAHEHVMAILNDPTTNIQTGVPIENAYASEYGIDNGNGDVRLGWDNHVDHGGTKTVITYKDPTTHMLKTLELRENCGGQRIVEMPDAPAPAPVYQAAPQPNYTPSVVEQPPVSNPPAEQPPVATPPVDTPPVAPPTPPVVPPTPENPPYVKGPGHGNEFVDQQPSGELRPPANIVSQIFGPSRDVGYGRAPIVDNAHEPSPIDRPSGVSSPNTAPSLSTSGATSAGDAGSTANGNLSRRP